MDPLIFFDKISNSPDNANSDSLVNMDNTQEVKDAKEFDMTSGTTQCYKQVWWCIIGGTNIVNFVLLE